MTAHAHLTLLALWAVSAPLMAQPVEPAPPDLLDQARAVAMRYSASLPDFLCTEVVRRARDPHGKGHWNSRDTLTVKLSYFDHREHYTLTHIDGKRTQRELYDVSGTVSTGEFGTRLYSLFNLRSNADFRWMGWKTLRRRRVGHFWYRIAREDSSFWVQNGSLPVGPVSQSLVEGPNAMIVAYHGDVWVDEETQMALRFTQEAEIPPGFPVSATAFAVDYDFAGVGGKQYLLPSHAMVTIRSGNYVAENKVDFRDYRKFHAESTLTFDAPSAKQ